MICLLFSVNMQCVWCLTAWFFFTSCKLTFHNNSVSIAVFLLAKKKKTKNQEKNKFNMPGPKMGPRVSALIYLFGYVLGFFVCLNILQLFMPFALSTYSYRVCSPLTLTKNSWSNHRHLKGGKVYGKVKNSSMRVGSSSRDMKTTKNAWCDA